jgi:hypothetical protein
LKADHLGRSRTIDLDAQRPTYATSFHGTIQTVAAWVQIDPATRQGLRRIDHADSVARDDAQQVSLVVSFPAPCTHADRPGHRLRLLVTAVFYVSHRVCKDERTSALLGCVSHRGRDNVAS